MHNVHLQFDGLAVGLVAFIIIGLFHPLVIKGEYYLGAHRCIPLFIMLGVLTAIASAACPHHTASAALGVVAFASFWSVKEVKQQQQRVDRGWFPLNPNHHK